MCMCGGVNDSDSENVVMIIKVLPVIAPHIDIPPFDPCFERTWAIFSFFLSLFSFLGG